MLHHDVNRDHSVDGEHGDAVEIPTLWHIGDLSGKRTKPYISYEGRGLSVSIHPDVWADIMQQENPRRSDDLMVYRLSHPASQFYFVDPTVNTEVEREWCLNNGYVVAQRGFKVSYEDAAGDTAYFLVHSKDVAKREAAARNGSFEPTQLLDLGSRGVAYWEEAFEQPPLEADPVVIEGLLPVWYAQEHGYDGVWWDERLDPANHSAPRGVIFQTALDEFTITTESDHAR